MGQGYTNLNLMLKKGLTKKVTSELRSECQERFRHKIFLDRIFHTEKQ